MKRLLGLVFLSLSCFTGSALAQQGTCIRWEDVTTQVPIYRTECRRVCHQTYCTDECTQVFDHYETKVTGRRCVQWSNPTPPPPPTPSPIINQPCVYPYSAQINSCDYMGCGPVTVSGTIICSPGATSVTLPHIPLTVNCGTCSAAGSNGLPVTSSPSASKPAAAASKPKANNKKASKPKAKKPSKPKKRK